ncbi:PEP-CTERM/exosortase system-associated acyltransferase [Thalassotalea sp. PLHSN55]|uniref:PEP-CTERM/exosortase system-associated acyltransferase n=1 Tax=Thalassotalea sp. PLHSN55 TaxID=3435888 RepID=UPI003F843BEC
MSSYSIAENFNQYFKIKFASTKELQQEAYKIRYGVYSEELGWEEPNPLHMESDECDKYAYHCLLEHRRTGVFAGCIRLVIPPAEDPEKKLPFEEHCLSSAKTEVLDTTTLPRGGFGEISRLAVLASFRRREKEKQVPFVLNDVNMDNMYSPEERRNFPNIAMGLYLSGLAMATIFNHVGLVVMMEPRLNRRLIRFGLPFEQIGDEMNYHGQRAMFFLAREKFDTELNDEIKKLYAILYDDLASQISLRKFSNNAEFNLPDIKLITP